MKLWKFWENDEQENDIIKILKIILKIQNHIKRQYEMIAFLDEKIKKLQRKK